jgi:hypothetical protein
MPTNTIADTDARGRLVPAVGSAAACIIAAAITPARLRTRKAVGITQHIKRLRGGGRGYCTGIRAAKRLRGDTGMYIGRAVDREYEACVKKIKPLASCSPRIKAVMRALAAMDITPVATKVRVMDRSIGPGADGLKTELDGLGYCYATSTFVVIELKTTQRTYAEHKQSYTAVDQLHPTMLNGLPHCEHTSHQLQGAFGMRCFARMYLPTKPVSGVVVVSCSDAHAAVYTVSSHLMHRRHYTLPAVMPRLVAPVAKAGLCEIEVGDARLRAVIGSKPQLSRDKRIASCPDPTGVVYAVLAASASPAATRLAKSRLRRCTRAARLILLTKRRGTAAYTQTVVARARPGQAAATKRRRVGNVPALKKSVVPATRR